MDNKQELRVWAKGLNRGVNGGVNGGVNTDGLNSILVEKLRNISIYKQSKHIMLFYPLENEVNLLELLQDKNKQFYLPKIDGENLLCCPYKMGDETCFSCFKTVEPISKPENKSILDLVIVPALCVDKNNYRLGYGGGFYDRFLKNCTAKTVVCISKQLIIDTINPEEFDIPVDLVITG